MEKSNNTFKYSEIFHSFQGEGFNTGCSTAWIRFFLCSLQCDGFGQKDPTDPSTYVLPYKDFDVSGITRVEDLPVFEQGCDSSYTWSARYKHLMHNDTASEICDKLQQSLAHQSNIDGLFTHPKTLQDHHLAFTGGEPLMKINQKAIVAIIEEFARRGNVPFHMTTETNGTQAITAELADIINYWTDDGMPHEWFWSVSPKLWTTAGEPPEKAIKPGIVGEYAKLSNHGQLKYVVNGTQESWDEVEHVTELFRNEGVGWDVCIMPVGATKEEQEESVISEIAMEAMKRGYHFSGRLHAYVFGNAIGT